jgi:hypothetical protein
MTLNCVYIYNYTGRFSPTPVGGSGGGKGEQDSASPRPIAVDGLISEIFRSVNHNCVSVESYDIMGESRLNPARRWQKARYLRPPVIPSFQSLRKKRVARTIVMPFYQSVQRQKRACEPHLQRVQS